MIFWKLHTITVRCKQELMQRISTVWKGYKMIMVSLGCVILLQVLKDAAMAVSSKMSFEYQGSDW